MSKAADEKWDDRRGKSMESSTSSLSPLLVVRGKGAAENISIVHLLYIFNSIIIYMIFNIYTSKTAHVLNMYSNISILFASSTHAMLINIPIYRSVFGLG